MLKKHWKLFSLIVVVFAGLALSIGALANKQAVTNKQTAEQEKKLSIDQVPGAVKATILAQGGTIEEIEMETENGQTVYEAEVVIDGQKIEMKVASDGTMLGKKVDDDDNEDENEGDDEQEDEDEDEQQVSIDQVPATVKATILEQAGTGTIKEIEFGNENGSAIYEAEVIIDGQKVEIKVAPDGNLISKELDDEDDE